MTDSTLESAYHLCKIYKGLQLHYNPKSKYSYNVYGPMNRYSADKFVISKERFTFVKFVKRFHNNEQTFKDFISFTVLKTGKVPYIIGLASEQLIREFEDTFLSNKNKVKYLFKNYIDSVDDLSDLKTNGIDYPEIFAKTILRGELFVDIFAICDIILKLSDRYTDRFENDIFFTEKLNIYLEYRKLLDISSDDLQYFKELLKSKM